MRASAHGEIADMSSVPKHEGFPFTVIRASESSWNNTLRECWRYRELLYFLTWRDIKVRYKQTILGLAWAIVQPLFLAITLSIFLGKLAKVPSDGLPYPVFVYTAMVIWHMFASALTDAGNSLLANERLITKVYFPRLLAPASAVLGSTVDFVFALVVLIPFLAYYHITPSAMLITAPLFICLAALIAFGAGLWLSALNVQYRDVRYTINFLVQLWFLATPVAYPSSIVPAKWRALYGLNPMVGVIEGFRWAVLGSGQPPGNVLQISVATTAVILAGGFYYFRRMEHTFADVI